MGKRLRKKNDRSLSSTLVTILFGIFFFVGCTVGPVYSPPEFEIPCEWEEPLPEGVQEDTADDLLWWEQLQDPTLNWLIESAACQNLDLQIAAMRICKRELL